MKHLKRYLFTGIWSILFLWVFSISTAAQENVCVAGKDYPKGIVIFIYPKIVDDDFVVYSIFKKNMVCEIENELSKKQEETKKARRLLEFIEKDPKKINKANNNRWLSKRDHKLKVYVLYEGETLPEIKFEEKYRETRFAQDLSTLAKLIMKMDILKAKKVSTKVKVIETSYNLRKNRALLTVSTRLKKNKSELKEKIEILTGKSEHWFLSADLQIKKASDLKYDADTHKLEPQETPEQFYLGINYMFGDALDEKQSLLKQLFIKAMFKFSKKPLDSWGIALGYRFPRSKFFGLIDLSSFSIFGGAAWSKIKEEKTDGSTESKTDFQWIFGISLNLDKALGWIE